MKCYEAVYFRVRADMIKFGAVFKSSTAGKICDIANAVAVAIFLNKPSKK